MDELQEVSKVKHETFRSFSRSFVSRQGNPATPSKWNVELVFCTAQKLDQVFCQVFVYLIMLVSLTRSEDSNTRASVVDIHHRCATQFLIKIGYNDLNDVTLV